jgi:hypothetical protein
MVIYLAGLQSIPTQLYEAATIDGAHAGQRFYTSPFHDDARIVLSGDHGMIGPFRHSRRRTS